MQKQSEKWRDIPGYEGYYQVSSLGNVRSVDRVVNRAGGTTVQLKGKILSQAMSGKCGYPTVTLVKDGIQKSFKVHYLVATTFLRRLAHHTQIDHIDTNRHNNNVSNLRWCTNKENCNNPITKERQKSAQIGKKQPQSQIDKRVLKLRGQKRSAEQCKNLRMGNGRNHAVVQFNMDGTLLKEYPSLAEAERETGIWHNNISKACLKQIKSCGGFLWRYK